VDNGVHHIRFVQQHRPAAMTVDGFGRAAEVEVNGGAPSSTARAALSASTCASLPSSWTCTGVPAAVRLPVSSSGQYWVKITDCP